MNCSSCAYANKSGNPDYVFCTYWQKECNEAKIEPEKFIRSVIFDKTLLNNIALGWGFPNKHCTKETHWSAKGTASEGLMWNNQICIQKDEWCQNHREVILK